MKKTIIISFLLISVFITSCQTRNHYQSGHSGGVKVEKLAQSTKSWDGSKLEKFASGQPEITILKIRIPPGVQLPLHKHPYINAGVLLSGQLTVVSESKKVLKLKAGDTIIELVNKWHYGKNEGKEDAVIIVFYAGIQGKAITIKK